MKTREILFEDKWLRVVKLNGWFVASEPTQSKDNMAVAVLPYKLDEEGDACQYLSRLELNPAHMEEEDKHQISVITGACETGNPLYHAKMELLEEGGYDIPESRFNFVGMVNPMKASCTKLYLYVVEIEDTDIQGAYEGDGSDNESREDCAWFAPPLMITAKDPYIQTMIMRQMTMQALGVTNWKEVEKDAVEAEKEYSAYLLDQKESGSTN